MLTFLIVISILILLLLCFGIYLLLGISRMLLQLGKNTDDVTSEMYMLRQLLDRRGLLDIGENRVAQE